MGRFLISWQVVVSEHLRITGEVFRESPDPVQAEDDFWSDGGSVVNQLGLTPEQVELIVTEVVDDPVRDRLVQALAALPYDEAEAVAGRARLLRLSGRP